MSTEHTLAEIQQVAGAITALIPATQPLIPTVSGAQVAREFLAANPELVTVQARRTGSLGAQVILAVQPETLKALAASEATSTPDEALYLLVESALATVGEGITTRTTVRTEHFLDATTITFLLQGGGEPRGWLALNFHEVTEMFDENPALGADEAENSDADTTATPEAAAGLAAAGLAGAAGTAGAAGAGAANVQPAQFTNVSTARSATRVDAMRMLYDVEMTLTAEIGRAKMPVKQILDLVPGTIVELDRVAGSPADLMVNGHLVARGEVVVVDEEYGLRITEIIDPEGMI